MGEREVRAHTGYLFSLRAFLRFGKGEIPIAHVVKLSLMRIMVMTSFIPRPLISLTQLIDETSICSLSLSLSLGH